MEGQGVCDKYVVLVTKLLLDIKQNVEEYRMLKDEYVSTKKETPQETDKIKNQAEKIFQLIKKIDRSYKFDTRGMPPLPPICGDNILAFMEKVLRSSNLTWFKHSQLFKNSLNDDYVVEMITMIDPLTPRKSSGGVRRSFKKRTTSTKRKSIKRSRGRSSNRRRHRRTARK